MFTQLDILLESIGFSKYTSFHEECWFVLTFDQFINRKSGVSSFSAYNF